MVTYLLAAGQGSIFDPIKNAVNAATKPEWFLTITFVVFVLMMVLYRWWTRPVVFGVIFGAFLIGYFGSMGDPNFRSIVAKPDNVPLTIMMFALILCICLALRRAPLNDAGLAAGLPRLEADKDDKVLVWPDLLYTELLCLV